MWYLPETTYSAFGERTDLMSRLLVTAVSIFAVASLSGCANMDIGKGKGKAPPPVIVEEPAPAPVYK
jgi:hypothetical protein